ncbi:hypothetical protein C900_01735 [Fulvivirga imtechensis AK7]|uniref:Secretion system C-terminal sorting domain-containing protein n=1 Tax=Fulvivirga imtechensis AK7 TaxID=1237149 RepID=L8JT78_9BACT|nr:T9SS type A sorting domain-containing protein [Fulvivirga imtechensis]ELR72181.1 hypothetical protein C900_01735 [Fulvivirga imtechensis AK7]
MRNLLLLICSLFFSTAQAQFAYQVDQTIPVSISNITLANPWAGGLNAAQYNTMDLNGDGKEDIVVFDRTGHKVYTFLQTAGGEYTFAPKYAQLFPDDLKGWMLLRDYNCDGKKDIFTSHSFGIRVFINTTVAGEDLSWTPYVTGKDNSGNDQYFLKTRGFTSDINMQMNLSDIPAIVDVDGDSDLDILFFRPSGASTIEFHKNLNIERTGTCDSLQYERVTQAWGNFEECECGSFAFNGTGCGSSGGRQQHQSGKALLLLDMDGDGDKDAVVSEESCPYLFYLENGGDKDNELVTGASNIFPNATDPVYMYLFPAAYYEDVDFDGIEDIIVSPNISSNISGSVNFQASNWLYKNTGTAQQPEFTQVKKNFLQDQMIDLGENAAPAFGDYDNDGDLDMLVGSYLNLDNPGFFSSIRLFKNTGSASNPYFVLENEDYLNLAGRNLFNIRPKLKDINADNLVDLVFSATSLTNFSTNIYYIINQSNGAFDFSSPSEILFSNIGADENFEIFDINSDGLVDLLVGKSTGKVEYWVNIGQNNAPTFALEDESFYNFDFSTSRYNTAIAIADLNADGREDLIAGDERGSLTIYSDFRGNLDNPQEGITEFIKPLAGDELSAYTFGSKLYPVVANLFGEDKPAIIIGSGQGGIQVIRNSESTSGRVNQFTIDIFPNPIIKSTGRSLTVQSKIAGNATIITILGQRVTDNFFLPANIPLKIPVDQLSSGIYMVILNVGGKEVIGQRFIVVE